MWCAAFALGNTSSILCPMNYRRLDEEKECESAAGIGGKVYGEHRAYSYYPAGCFWHTITGSVYFNADPDGVPNYYAKPLCAGAAGILRGVRIHVCCGRRTSTEEACLVVIHKHTHPRTHADTCNHTQRRALAYTHTCACTNSRQLARGALKHAHTNHTQYSLS